LCDQPNLTPEIINRLIAAFKAGKAGIIVPVHQGRRGNPVVLDLSYRHELMDLSGDVGARQLLARHAGDVHEVEAGSDAVLQDIDTEDQFRDLPP
ncbi:MAG: NTP transferase domain-containing protein, partial [Chloroflexi bacterium]|nr:NTP transferase domain-containing protein [Chloroflexota bacterium]